jgi:hypothetical protein
MGLFSITRAQVLSLWRESLPCVNRVSVVTPQSGGKWPFSSHFILAVILISLSSKIHAHTPVINDGSAPMTIEYPFEIEKPEHSKAIFSELTGRPHYYKINSQKYFRFYAGLTAPKLDDCALKQTFDLRILDDDSKEIDRRNGKSRDWWPWYEKYGKTWYWIGPEIGSDFKSNRIYYAGAYFIEVSNQTNSGKYVLAVGDEERFGFTTIAGMLLKGTMGKIRRKWWDNSNCK